LAYSSSIASDRLIEIDVGLNDAIRIAGTEFVDNVENDRGKLFRPDQQTYSASEATPREIKHVVDEIGHPLDATLHEVE
jgi:hypothetical protein